MLVTFANCPRLNPNGISGKGIGKNTLKTP